ncbi:hypothetical protein [Streptomyces antimicrobicus]|uniref:Tat pathway signal sequence domain protein n=1 Tax=Streptomyces antimicrobicus TaxID=2883108 RepID=A0ABS8B2U3_9ACTN|nr:hypothetical protein [Streptomyces antimicrobicus]MCB5178907.1 hypothetical protein [Streptomyces antimicrobicus]
MTEQSTTAAGPELPDPAPAGPELPDPAPAGPELPEPAPAAPAQRRGLRAALRWTAAAVVFAVAGAGVAYGITRADRTDVPGLATAGDGRWDYPALTKPALPAGAPLPFAPDNRDGLHYAALSQLLLPAPRGSAPDASVKADKDGVVPLDGFLEEYSAEERPKLRDTLSHEGLRQIVGRGWTMPDGTRTHVYLLRFASSGFVDTFTGCTFHAKVAGAAALEEDVEWGRHEGERPGGAATVAVKVRVYQEPLPAGDEHTKLGCVQSGDVQAVIVQTRKGEVPGVPVRQAVILQEQLLR